VPSVNVYSFCYGQSTPQYNVSVAAQLMLYSTPIPFLGRTGYAIAGMNGTRAFTSLNGNSSVNSIIGPSSDWYAKQINSAVSYDQLFTLSNSSEIVDTQGILYQFTGTAQTPIGGNYELQVVRLYWNATGSSYTEELEVGVVGGGLVYSEVPITQTAVVADNGASAANGTVASTYCGVANPPSVVNTTTATASSSSTGGVAYLSSSSASSGGMPNINAAASPSDGRAASFVYAFAVVCLLLTRH